MDVVDLAERSDLLADEGAQRPASGRGAHEPRAGVGLGAGMNRRLLAYRELTAERRTIATARRTIADRSAQLAVTQLTHAMRDGAG